MAGIDRDIGHRASWNNQTPSGFDESSPTDISWRKSSGLGTSIRRIWKSLPGKTGYTLSAHSLIEMYFFNQKEDATAPKRKCTATSSGTTTRRPKRIKAMPSMDKHIEALMHPIPESSYIPDLQNATIPQFPFPQSSDTTSDYPLDTHQTKRSKSQIY